VRWLLDGKLHPGGTELTRRLAQLAGIGHGSRVLDVASGTGTTALLLARELGAEVVGVELGEEAVAEARAGAAEAGLDGSVSFAGGDAAALPLDDASVDAVLCECSLCLFEDKQVAVREMARVLRPGGSVAIADVTVERDSLPAELLSAASRVACIADALPLEGYELLLREAGLHVKWVEQRYDAIAAMADTIEGRLRAARIMRVPGLEPLRPELDGVVGLARLAKRALADRQLGYALIVARVPR
jgi:ubiquinone/menaquinone biosynthesis C-methylase UbiE